MSDFERKEIKVGTLFWLSNVGAFIALVGILFFMVFLGILLTGKFLPFEIKLIYYFEVMSKYVYYGFGISLVTSVIGYWIARRRVWTRTDLIIDGDRLEFLDHKETISLPKQRILKLVLLRSYFMTDNKVRIKTIGLKEYIVRMNNDVYNNLFDIYPDRFYKN